MHKVLLSREAEDVYRWLFQRERKLYERIKSALHALAADPRQGKLLKGPIRDRWSLRVGSYRIIYRIDSGRLVVLVLDIGHRREIYRSA